MEIRCSQSLLPYSLHCSIQPELVLKELIEMVEVYQKAEKEAESTAKQQSKKKKKKKKNSIAR